MERLTIQIPEKKSKLIKSLLKELGATIEPDILKLTKEFDSRGKTDEIPTMDEIVAEIRAYRAGK
ncbi:hypothetical protein EWM62_12675 [Mucilaginibacter terrigena]|uniref:Uncharacterized protein n=1 Tax=Mucilaginibacter terrigena TaxID=2492395 RepID=A0A4Q5LKY1_9SPHI|nr:hypothetical protein [Mucilaginibacter terrigena]RYU90374.1 hypothetical protein EWM62_12675 [Mucilaginibacter terrigena]